MAADGVILHCARMDGPIAGCNGRPGTILVRKEEQEGTMTRKIMEIRADALGGAETLPDARCGRGQVLWCSSAAVVASCWARLGKSQCLAVANRLGQQ